MHNYISEMYTGMVFTRIQDIKGVQSLGASNANGAFTTGSKRKLAIFGENSKTKKEQTSKIPKPRKLEVRPGTETEMTDQLDLVALRVLHGEVRVTQGHRGHG